MSDSVYLGSRVGQLETGDVLDKISRVNLNVDSDTYYTSGDDTGRTLEVTCPWGTQAMADSILAAVKDYDYTPYTATDALLDPATEIGDAVTVGGIYSVLANLDTVFDRACAPSISAPESDEIDDEYPYESKEQREINRQLAQTRSLISKTSEEILLQVENELKGLSSSFSVQLQQITARVDGLEGDFTEVSVTLDGLTVTDGSGTTKIKGDRVETENLYVNAANISGTLTANQINLTGAITWGDLASDAQNQVTSAQNLASSAYGTAVSAQTAANTANSQLYAWTYPGSTMINGQMLMTGTVMASKLLGGSVGLLASDQTVVGSLDIAYTTTGIGLGMTSNYGGMRLKASGGNVYVESGYGPYVQLGQGAGIGKAVCQLGGGPIVLDANSFGTVLPSSGVYGQVFFLLG